MVHIKTHIFNHFCQQCLVLLNLVPRNSIIKDIVVRYAGIWGTKLPGSQVPSPITRRVIGIICALMNSDRSGYDPSSTVKRSRQTGYNSSKP